MNIEKIADNIYTFPIVLPNNPLKWLNCYVVSSANRNLLIDTGFNRPECREALLDGMRQLGLTADNTDIFLTHLHSDHTGNAAYLAGEGFNILMGRTDHRVITMPQFLANEIQDYLKMLYGIGPHDRMFTVTKSYLHREMERGAKEAGVKRIRIHDIRHSAVSLLIDMGFSATAIADRVGHESIDITYNYAHLFPSKQAEMADKLNMERGN